MPKPSNQQPIPQTQKPKPTKRPPTLAILSLSTIATLNAAAIFTAITQGLQDLFILFLFALTVHITASILVMRILITFFPTKDGIYPLDSPEAQRWMAQGVTALVSSIFFSPIIPFFFKPTWYRLFGARIGAGATIAGRIIDAPLCVMEANTAIGGEAILFGHLVTGDKIHIGKIILREGSVAGARSTLSPGVELGKNAVAGPASFIPPGRTIAEGEIWQCPPAVRVPQIKEALHSIPDVTVSRFSERNLPKLTTTPFIDTSTPVKNAKQIRKELYRYIATDLLNGVSGTEAESDEDWIDATLFDSVALVQLATFLDDRYGIKIAEVELQAEHLQSLDALTRFVSRVIETKHELISA